MRRVSAEGVILRFIHRRKFNRLSMRRIEISVPPGVFSALDVFCRNFCMFRCQIFQCRKRTIVIGFFGIRPSGLDSFLKMYPERLSPVSGRKSPIFNQ